MQVGERVMEACFEAGRDLGQFFPNEDNPGIFQKFSWLQPLFQDEGWLAHFTQPSQVIEIGPISRIFREHRIPPALIESTSCDVSLAHGYDRSQKPSRHEVLLGLMEQLTAYSAITEWWLYAKGVQIPRGDSLT